MPLYEYRCEACGHRFTLMVRMSERSAQDCPTCERRATKIVSGGGFILKGNGWARDGYAKEKNDS